jgi:hypothetical protein
MRRASRRAVTGNCAAPTPGSPGTDGLGVTLESAAVSPDTGAVGSSGSGGLWPFGSLHPGGRARSRALGAGGADVDGYSGGVVDDRVGGGAW